MRSASGKRSAFANLTRSSASSTRKPHAFAMRASGCATWPAPNRHSTGVPSIGLDEHLHPPPAHEPVLARLLGREVVGDEPRPAALDRLARPPGHLRLEAAAADRADDAAVGVDEHARAGLLRGRALGRHDGHERRALAPRLGLERRLEDLAHATPASVNRRAEPLERRRQHSTVERARQALAEERRARRRGPPRRASSDGHGARRRPAARRRSATSSARSRGRMRSSTTAAGRRRAADSTASTPSGDLVHREAERPRPRAGPRAACRRRRAATITSGARAWADGAEERQREAEGRALAGRARAPRSGRRARARSARRSTGPGRSPRSRSCVRSCSREKGRNRRPRSSGGDADAVVADADDGRLALAARPRGAPRRRRAST